eukprot:TRINITY_DN3713_c0_g1_i10.p2 TRINITY_DN3713_c0_g1~~TRINITY_DN3713_c0_g1_i10.p2  ORF type:complete len:149 (+),score=31.81 TRINITY_DN3713_c0_g1_i10:898-1344(+)
MARMDYDPFGVDILLQYMIGSSNFAFNNSNLVTTSIKWYKICHFNRVDSIWSRLGILSEDCKQLSPDCLMALSERDRDKAKQLLSMGFVMSHPLWRNEVERMLKDNNKAEIQALSTVKFDFLEEVYVPTKIVRGLHLEAQYDEVLMEG